MKLAEVAGRQENQSRKDWVVRLLSHKGTATIVVNLSCFSHPPNLASGWSQRLAPSKTARLLSLGKGMSPKCNQ